MLGKDQFAQIFKVGEIIESGAGSFRKKAASLKILTIEDDFIRYQSVHCARSYKTSYSVLNVLLERFESVRPKSITRSVNVVLKKAKIKSDHVTEAYAFSLAKAIRERWNLPGGKSPVDSTRQTPSQDYSEGGRISSLVERIERDPRARSKCIKHWGAWCQVCKFDFEKTYGLIGTGFIHVHHHRRRLASMTGKHKVDPVKDLIPLCPNCHAMVHAKKEMLTIAQLRKHLALASGRNPR